MGSLFWPSFNWRALGLRDRGNPCGLVSETIAKIISTNRSAAWRRLGSLRSPSLHHAADRTISSVTYAVGRKCNPCAEELPGRALPLTTYAKTAPITVNRKIGHFMFQSLRSRARLPPDRFLVTIEEIHLQSFFLNLEPLSRREGYCSLSGIECTREESSLSVRLVFSDAIFSPVGMVREAWKLLITAQ